MGLRPVANEALKGELVRCLQVPRLEHFGV